MEENRPCGAQEGKLPTAHGNSKSDECRASTTAATGELLLLRGPIANEHAGLALAADVLVHIRPPQ